MIIEDERTKESQVFFQFFALYFLKFVNRSEFYAAMSQRNHAETLFSVLFQNFVKVLGNY